MKKNVKNVAYIQDFFLLTDEQVKKYMGNIKFITEEDALIIYKFIVCCNKCYKITNFCLNINSGSLEKLNTLIKKNRKLDNCYFIATRSNANSVRDIISKNIYFTLSSVDIMISEYINIEPYNIMTIVSDTITPYYDQIYEIGPKPAYRISELTIEIINEFVDKGGKNLLIALRNAPVNEFEKLNKILLDPLSKYVNFATFLELDAIDIPILDKLNKKLLSTTSIASNVSIIGLTDYYPDINSFTLYDNCAIQLVNYFNEWEKFVKKSFIAFNRFTKIIGINKIKDTNELLTTTRRARTRV
jgi:hypothetical protein